MGVHSVTKDLNPFLNVIDKDEEKTMRDNEDTQKHLRAWPLENLNALSLNVIAKKVIDLLEPHLSDHQCEDGWTT